MKRLGRSFASCNRGIRTSMCSTVSGWRLDRGGSCEASLLIPVQVHEPQHLRRSEHLNSDYPLSAIR